jgi:quercetin dioxygenase-like cupin family protein
MNIPSFPFSITDFNDIEAVIHPGTTGHATWQTIYRNDIRIRLVKYSPGYQADHWCSKGHIIFCVEGEMTTTLESDNSKHLLKAGMVYTVGDGSSSHSSYSGDGCTLFIVD